MQYAIGQTYTFKLSQLVRSVKYQSRTKQERTAQKYIDGLEELGALILAQGLLQNLIGFQQKKGKKLLTTAEIVGGGRRLDTLALLAERKLIDPDTFDIPVLMCTEAEALAKSLAENSGRENLTPADQFRAFQALNENGQTSEEIATAFGVDEITIKRRLKLANVAPRLFALYEEGTATLDQLMALALTEDHATQEQVWDSLPQYQRSAYQIKALITTQEIDISNNKVAAFVGLDEYEAGGGEVRRDLFSEKGGYIKDAALLESLAVSKLERLSEHIKAAGWAWIDYCTNLSYDERNKFGKIKTIERDMSDEDQATVEAKQAKIAALQTEIDAYYDGDDGDDEDAPELSEEEEQARQEANGAKENEVGDLESEIDALQAKYIQPDPAYVAIAGAIVTLDHAGKVVIYEGLVRPEDKKEVQKSAAAARVAAGEAPGPDDEQDDDEPAAKVKSVHSEKLVRQLTAHRTAALQVMVSENTPVALVVLAHSMALSVFDFGTHGRYSRAASAAQISLQHTRLSSESEDVKDCKALAQFATSQAAWADLLPTDSEDLFAWLLEQEQEVVLNLLAFCTAHTLNTVQGNEQENIPAKQIGAAVKLDMADWWQPTRSSYFSQVSKQHIIGLVSSEVSPQIAAPMATLKKVPLTEAAEQNMKDRRWLPAILKAA